MKTTACVLLTLVLALTVWLFYSPTKTVAQAPQAQRASSCPVPQAYGMYRGGVMLSINGSSQMVFAFEGADGTVRFVQPGTCALVHMVTRQ